MKKMNTTKKILVALAVMMVAAAIAAPAAMGAENLGYSATVGAGQNTVLTMVSGYGFGTVVSPSTNNQIDNTFKLNNNGNKAAQVKAKFTTSVDTTYGLVNSTNVIGGSNFSLQADAGGSKDALNNDGNPKTLTYQVPADGNDYTYDAWLDVPAMMPDGSYNGNVQLTFSTVP
jgi:hypothetical protein